MPLLGEIYNASESRPQFLKGTPSAGQSLSAPAPDPRIFADKDVRLSRPRLAHDHIDHHSMPYCPVVAFEALLKNTGVAVPSQGIWRHDCARFEHAAFDHVPTGMCQASPTIRAVGFWLAQGKPPSNAI